MKADIIFNLYDRSWVTEDSVEQKAAKIILCVSSNVSGWRNTINFRFKIK